MAEGDTKPWHDGLDSTLVEHITAKGWDKVDAQSAARAASLAHLAAQRLIGVPAEQVVRLPKTPDDPAYAEAYKRVAEFGAPKEASGYSFDGVKGIKEEDAAFVRELAAELKLPVNAAASLAQRLVTRAETLSAAEAEKRAVALAADETALRQAWGPDYDQRLFQTTRVAEALGWDKTIIDTLQTTVGGTKVLNALLQLAGKMGEAPFLKGATSYGAGSMTREQAAQRKEALKTDTTWVKKYLAGGADEIRELENLDRIILGAQAR